MSAKTEYQVDEAITIMGIIWAIMELTHKQNRHSEGNIRQLLNLPYSAKRTVRNYIRLLTQWGVIRKSKPPQNNYGRGRNTFYLVDLSRLPEHVWKVEISRTTIYRWKQSAVEDGWVYRSGRSGYFLDGKNIMGQADCAKIIRRLLREGVRKEGAARGYRDHEIEKIIMRITDEDRMVDGLSATTFDIEFNLLELFHDYLIWKFNVEYTGVALS